MMKAQSIRVGCSGWQYAHWKGTFYPPSLPSKKWLPYYAAQFDTVEINNSFYRLPTEKTFSEWRERVPDRFLFAVKASRYLTHLKRLKDPADPIDLFWSRARLLGPKLGPVLYQLPPYWKRNEKRFLDFLDALPEDGLHVVEFRDPTWYTDGIFRAMEAKGVALCLHDHPESAPPRERVGPFVYVRFHGFAEHPEGSYPKRHLREWAAWLGKEADADRAVFAYFNNDAFSHAPQNAKALRESLLSMRQKKEAA
ncbi:MAG: DUF72 domain-containing protein [Candidatus Manganitrophaceae bacterium]|nr:MAG: DUF72 domain-containing protein [Candidatus Manganitrophaceae bacterium]